MRVRCKTTRHPDGRVASLTVDATYEVIGIEADDLRLINDRGDPVLFDPEMFEIVDPGRPADWVSSRGDEGEEYAGPEAFDARGFWEDFHDHVPAARAAFSRYLNDHLRTTDAA